MGSSTVTVNRARAGHVLSHVKDKLLDDVGTATGHLYTLRSHMSGSAIIRG